MPIIGALSVFFCISFFSGQAFSHTCYYPNGEPVPDTKEMGVCQNHPVQSICCALNRSNPSGGNRTDGDTIDECLSNGLCQNRVAEAEGHLSTTWWAVFCTEKDYSSGKCLDVCRGTRTESGGTQMTPCDDQAAGNSTRWCCGNSKSCCLSNSGVVEIPNIFNGRVGKDAFASPSSTSSPTGSLQPTSSPSQSATTSPEGLSTGAKAGVGVGVVLGVLVLIGTALFTRKVMSWRRAAVGSRLMSVDHAPVYPIYINETTKYANAGYPPLELSPRAEIIELPESTMPPSELPQPTAPLSELSGTKIIQTRGELGSEKHSNQDTQYVAKEDL